MTNLQYYGHPLPGPHPTRLPGKLIVLEGTDGVGRSTHIALLREWLEANGYAVAYTGQTRSLLPGAGLKTAKRGHTLSDRALALYYATDFADRLEREIIPALRAGFVVLTDRYIYSLIARASVRGEPPDWLAHLYGFALVPDAILFLRADLEHLIPRVLSSRGFDYWESGMDVLKTGDRYTSYVQYQTMLLEQFERMAAEYNFHIIDANRNLHEVFRELKDEIGALVADMKPQYGVPLVPQP